MPRVCQVTGKRHTRGNNKSHAHNLTRRSFKPNIQSKRFWFENENRFVKLRVSAKGMKKVDKVGIEAIVEELRARGEKI